MNNIDLSSDIVDCIAIQRRIHTKTLDSGLCIVHAILFRFIQITRSFITMFNFSFNVSKSSQKQKKNKEGIQMEFPIPVEKYVCDIPKTIIIKLQQSQSQILHTMLNPKFS